MGESTSTPDRFNRLADEFPERYRRAERPPLSESAQKYPELAGQARERSPPWYGSSRSAPGPTRRPTRSRPAGPARGPSPRGGVIIASSA
jgi:hypothetical protein